jgi:tyrosine-protein phosphatase non-receptor type 4
MDNNLDKLILWFRSSPQSPSVTEDYPELAPGFAGQFHLDQTEETGYTTLKFSNHHSNREKEVGDYYDELNAAEELAGQMTIDDLASEGFLLVRLLPDEEGRFGFHFKGGVDLNIPVFISKVKDNSPASICDPPLQEGDQVLFVNGMPTDTATHMEVITAIKSTLDKQPPQLVLIIKPTDMSRIDPPQQEALPFTSDPHTLLRDSVVQLKESVLNGTIVHSFDRLYRRKPGTLTIASKLPQNLSKNRYRDITAYDTTRVFLLDCPVDYINANKIEMVVPSTNQRIHYIAAQGPMQNTCIDFWQVRAIVAFIILL